MLASSRRQQSGTPSLHVTLSTMSADDLRRCAQQFGIDAFGLDSEELRAAIIDAASHTKEVAVWH